MRSESLTWVLPVQRERGGSGELAIRLSDLLISGATGVVAFSLFLFGREVPHGLRSAFIYLGLALGLPLFRALSFRFPARRIFAVVASFWLLPTAAIGHCAFEPVIDVLGLRLVDKYLALADLRLFGVHPALLLSGHLTGAMMDVLLVCYYTYFLWPVLLGVWLYRNERRAAEMYFLALTVCYIANFLCYAFFPAVGPRYFLPSAYGDSLHGALLTPYLESLMRMPVFAADCFPSGHTAITLVVLIFAYRHWRPYFWTMLPCAVGLIVATLAGRFHYGVDLLFAIPLALTTTAIASALFRARPAGFVLPVQLAAFRPLIRV